jgi:hypothetical protein
MAGFSPQQQGTGMGFSPQHQGMAQFSPQHQGMAPAPMPMMQPTMMGASIQDIGMRVYNIEQELTANRAQHNYIGCQLGELGAAQEQLHGEIDGLRQDALGQQEVQQAELAASAKLGGAATQDDLQKVRAEAQADVAKVQLAVTEGEKRWRNQLQQLQNREDGDGGTTNRARHGDSAAATERYVEGQLRALEASMTRLVETHLETWGSALTRLVEAKLSAQDAAVQEQLLQAAKVPLAERQVDMQASLLAETRLSAQDDAIVEAKLRVPDAAAWAGMREQLLQAKAPLEELRADMQAAPKVDEIHRAGHEGAAVGGASWGSRCSSQASETSLLGELQGAELAGLHVRLDIQEAKSQEAEQRRKDTLERVAVMEKRMLEKDAAHGATLQGISWQMEGQSERLQVHDALLAGIEGKLEGHSERLAVCGERLQAHDARLEEHGGGSHAGDRVRELVQELTNTQDARDALPAECGALARAALEDAVQQLTAQLQQARRQSSPESLLDRLKELETRVGTGWEGQGAPGSTDNGQAQQLATRVEQIEATLCDLADGVQVHQLASRVDQIEASLDEAQDQVQSQVQQADGADWTRQAHGYRSPASADGARHAHGGRSPAGGETTSRGFSPGRRGRAQHQPWRADSRQASMRLGSPGAASMAPSNSSGQTTQHEEMNAKFTAALKTSGLLSRCRLTKESADISTSTKDIVSLLDFWRMCEGTAQGLEPSFEHWGEATRIRVIGGRIDTTFTAACDILQRAKDEGWDYKHFKLQLTDEVAPELRARCKHELETLRRSDTGGVAAFLRDYRDKLRDAYSAGISTGTGDAKATEEAVRTLMGALGENSTAAFQLWNVFATDGGGAAWSQAQQPLMEIIAKFTRSLPPTVSVSGKSTANAQHRPKAGAQLKTAAAGYGEREEAAQLKVSYSAAAAEIAERFGPDRFPRDRVMDCLGGFKGNGEKLCPLCEQAPHTKERMERHGMPGDAWRVCPIWTAPAPDKAGSPGSGNGAAATYVTNSQRQGKPSLRQAEGHSEEELQAGHDSVGGSGNEQ